MALFSLTIFATCDLALSCQKYNFQGKHAFVDEFRLQFIELLQGTSWYLLCLFQVAAPSTLRLLRPTKY